MNREWELFIRDMYDAILHIKSFDEGMSRSFFCKKGDTGMYRAPYGYA